MTGLWTRVALAGALLAGPSLRAEEAAGPAELPAAAQAAAPREALTLGSPTPLSRRPVILPAMGVEAALRYGLVGNSPTRFVDDVRFAPLDWLELRTALTPIPDSLMIKVALGDLDGVGVFAVDGGLYKLDLGLRLNPKEAAEVKGLIVVNLGAGLAYDHRVTDRGRVHVVGRVQQRLSNLDGADQTAAMGAVAGDLDLTSYLGLSLGLAYGRVVAGEARDFTLNFADSGRSGFLTLLDRDSPESLSGSLGLTYARTERFDVDIFATLRVWPEVQSIFGAGLRWRL